MPREAHWRTTLAFSRPDCQGGHDRGDLLVERVSDVPGDIFLRQLPGRGLMTTLHV